jgi:hypothetical protein
MVMVTIYFLSQMGMMVLHHDSPMIHPMPKIMHHDHVDDDADDEHDVIHVQLLHELYDHIWIMKRNDSKSDSYDKSRKRRNGVHTR